MGRGHLSRLLIVVLVLAAAVPAAAASTVSFRVVAHGISTTTPAARPFALVGTSRASAHRIALDVPASAARPILNANYRTSIVVGVFGAFGCKDGRVRVTRVTQAGRTLAVHIAIEPLAPGIAECDAIYETFRALVVPRAQLHGIPAEATVTVARS